MFNRFIGGCLIGVLLLLFIVAVVFGSDTSRTEYLAPRHAGWVPIADSQSLHHRQGRDQVVLEGARFEILGTSEEFGALCVITKATGAGQTSARIDDLVWIDPHVISTYEDRVNLQRDKQNQELDEVKRIVSKSELIYRQRR